MVVASLIATMAFQGGVNPPGGVWQGNADPDTNLTVLKHDNIIQNGSPSPTSNMSPNTLFEPPIKAAGMPVLMYYNSQIYYGYIVLNMAGFFTSLSIIFLLISGLCIKRRAFVGLLMGVLWVSITFMAFAYTFAIFWFTRYDEVSSISYAVYIWYVLLGVVVIVHFIRFIKWSLKKLGILMRKDAGGKRGRKSTIPR